MRRWILAATSAVAFAAALVVGPLGAAAVPPYVYACEGGLLVHGAHLMALRIFNGTTTTAKLTHKLLAGDGTIVNDQFTNSHHLPLTSALPAKHTASYYWTMPDNILPDEANGIVAASIRIVSSVPVTVTVNWDQTNTWLDWHSAACLPQ